LQNLTEKELAMLTAADLMTSEVITVTKETTVRELAELFVSNRISSVPVVDATGTLIGMVSENDLIEQDKSVHLPTVVSLFDWVFYLESERKFTQELKKMTGQTVGELYVSEVTTVTPASPINEIADLLSAKGSPALPVVEGGRLVGIVARIDLIRAMLNKG
jgi:CBS domain-containing protein